MKIDLFRFVPTLVVLWSFTPVMQYCITFFGLQSENYNVLAFVVLTFMGVVISIIFSFSTDIFKPKKKVVVKKDPMQEKAEPKEHTLTDMKNMFAKGMLEGFRNREFIAKLLKSSSSTADTIKTYADNIFKL